jgi:hypothetical protein
LRGQSERRKDLAPVSGGAIEPDQVRGDY